MESQIGSLYLKHNILYTFAELCCFLFLHVNTWLRLRRHGKCMLFLKQERHCLKDVCKNLLIRLEETRGLISSGSVCILSLDADPRTSIRGPDQSRGLQISQECQDWGIMDPGSSLSLCSLHELWKSQSVICPSVVLLLHKFSQQDAATKLAGGLQC